MVTVWADADLAVAESRRRLYGGAIFVLSPRASLRALVEHARGYIDEAFAPLDPRMAQHALPVERFVEIVGPLKPRFIHDPVTSELIRAVLDDLGFDRDNTYYDKPRMRVSTSGDYLSSGVAYALHPHRDMWYSQPYCQMNWWLPVYDFDDHSGFEFYPQYFETPVKNGSGTFNYYAWNASGRKDSAKHVGADTRRQPKPEEDLDLRHGVQVVCPAGGAVVFSGAHLHETVPNTSGRTRFSIDFRTADRRSLLAGEGAPNVDATCTGTSLRDLRRLSDSTPVDEEIVAQYDSGDVPEGGVLEFTPEAAGLHPVTLSSPSS
jgi:Phytanoyl-CoA dioxygenase (PhyH)